MMYYTPFNIAFNRYAYRAETRTICHNLKHLKEISGLSYRKLSVELGFGPKTLVNYITGYVRPNRERLEIIVEYFRIEKLDDLCMDENDFKLKYPQMKQEMSS